jgi:uncharacterized protein (TIGR02246 family)
MRKHLMTLAIVVLALVAGSRVGWAQNKERIDIAINATPNELAQSGSRQTPANNLQDEIAKMLRLHYDAFTKLDAALVNNNFTDNGFVSVEGKMIPSLLLKAGVRRDFASTPANGNYHFEVEDLRVFQPDAGTAVANYRLTSTPSNKKLTTVVENITDIFVRRDGRWLIFAEHESDSPKPVEPIVSGLPSGWQRTPGGKADNYLIYVDSEIKHGGQASASIKFNCGEHQYPWASLAQSIAADEYRDKRVRLSGWLKTVDAGEAGLWMRVDGEQRMLAFDNMSDRVVSGTTDWKMYSVVLDVPDDAKNIFLGVLLTGKGQTWADDLTFEVVGRKIAVTNKALAENIDDPDRAKIPKATIKRPINLGFEEGKVP